MAGGSLLLLLDDIATLLDDVATMTKVAAGKTAGVLGDDLALNAEQVSGVRAEREIPVVWAVAKGSLLNKVILVPLALLISAFASWLIVPLLMIGGTYLCFEGAEKLAHRWLHSKAEDAAAHQEELIAVANPDLDLVSFERDKIKGAVRTDFVLSAEIIAIVLGTVAQEPLLTQALVLSVTALLITVVVYGLVGGIVKLDDLGLWMVRTGGASARAVGRLLLLGAPKMMKALSVVGTVAMFLVGGGIVLHGISPLHHALQAWWSSWAGVDWALELGVTAVFGVAWGLAAVGVVTTLARLRR
jgi:uncharacterized protein